MNESKFDGMGSIYSQFRPAYPEMFIDYLYSDVGMTRYSVIADIGSGTGILTRQLLEKGGMVYAVEPNADMRAIAEADLSGFSGFVSVNGAAEHTTLAEKSVDFIIVAQAFHWFDRQRFRIECKRIMKANGKVVLVWNSRDESSGLVQENEVVIRKYCPDFKGYSGGVRGPENDDDLNDFFPGSYEIKAFRNDLIFDCPGFVGRNLSGSYAPKEGDDSYTAYVDELSALFDRHSNNGQLIMPNVTRCYTGSI